MRLTQNFDRPEYMIDAFFTLPATWLAIRFKYHIEGFLKSAKFIGKE